MARAIEISKVTKTYGQGRGKTVQALAQTDLKLRAGEFFSLVGPSGCGKSTLLNILAGLLEPSSGTVTIGDAVVRKPNPATSVVFQRASLLRWLTVHENVCLPSKINGRLDRAALERAEHYLEMAGLAGVAKRYPTELSGGMQQRASIVRALVSDPDVLLMDEPFSALDEFTRETLQDELLRLWMDRPKTVVFITHHIAEAIYLSDRVGVMTTQPGALSAVVDVPFARPRTPSLRTDSDFYALTGEIRHLIDQTPAVAKGA
ncbi:ABC transporter ATP-binding protein [Rhodococcus sp. NPDC127530]|uniref:ABC transporter ATP-binding protein n=1 Tax=unclassified Rhodococcus (in: high G+C Gram-positive bacteria) TaxID=192944 RepID=UPI00362D3904